MDHVPFNSGKKKCFTLKSFCDLIAWAKQNRCKCQVVSIKVFPNILFRAWAKLLNYIDYIEYRYAFVAIGHDNVPIAPKQGPMTNHSRKRKNNLPASQVTIHSTRTRTYPSVNERHSQRERTTSRSRLEAEPSG